MPATVAMIGLTHPHSAMYLDTLDALDAVGGIALYDQDTTTAREVAAACRKAVGVHDDLAPLLSSAEIAHALVAVPTAQSPAILVRAIEAGTPVFTEKPAARAAAEFAPVVAALDRRPVAFAIAYLNRWHPALRQLRDLYREGAIGRLMAVELRMVTTQARFRNPGHWLFRREAAGGGILSWLGCHWLDLARYLSGDEVASVAAQLATTSDEAIDVEDTAAVAFRLAGGAEGSLHAGYLLAAGAPGYEGTSYDMAVHLRGTLGTLAYHRGNAGGALTLDSVAPGWETPTPRAIPFAQPPSRGYGGGAGLDSFRAFLAASPRDPMPAGATDALRVLEIFDAIYEADATGRTVAVARRPRSLPGDDAGR